MGATDPTKKTPTIGRQTAEARRAAGVGVQVPDVPSLDEAKVASQAGTNGPLNDALGADGVGPEREFVLDYVDSRGRRWTGDFKAKVLTVKDTIQLGLVKARLAGGVPVSHLDPDTALTLEVLAHLSVAIVARPPWAKDLMALYEAGVLAAIYEEVAGHEARFRKPVSREAGEVDGDRAG
jgi:hypothetical protein